MGVERGVFRFFRARSHFEATQRSGDKERNNYQRRSVREVARDVRSSPPVRAPHGEKRKKRVASAQLAPLEAVQQQEVHEGTLLVGAH